MATSGTYGFSPSLGDTVLYAFSRCGLRRTQILQEHMEDARMASNMICADWSNKGVNLWQVVLETQVLTQGTSTYTVDPSVVVILDGYVSINNGSQTIDRYILPISRTEYASYPNKAQQGFPTTYWHDRLLSPTVTLWPVPDGQEASFNYYVVKQIQDATLPNAVAPDVPYLWLKAFSDALSVELAVIWAPDRLAFLAPAADKSYLAASDCNEEIAQTYISPMVNGYWRA